MAVSDLDSALQAKADEVRTAVQAIGITGSAAPGSFNEVGGGTPTGPSLTFLNSHLPLQDTTRANYVLLLTDGLPNCNASNTNNCTAPTSCRCTTTSCGSDLSAPFCTLGCLDQAGASSAVSALRGRNIRTVVVGFGADTTSGDAPLVLNELANAGGLARTCPNGTSAECGPGGSCDVPLRLCTRRYYQAANASELQAVLAEIAARL
jgi:hypothetical protein